MPEFERKNGDCNSPELSVEPDVARSGERRCCDFVNGDEQLPTSPESSWDTLAFESPAACRWCRVDLRRDIDVVLRNGESVVFLVIGDANGLLGLSRSLAPSTFACVNMSSSGLRMAE